MAKRQPVVDASLHPLHGWRFAVPSDQTRNQFFQTQVGNRRLVAFMRYAAVAQPYLAAEPTIKLSAVAVYGIHAGAIDGMEIGYVFSSPLSTRVDPFFCLFHRPQMDAISLVREGAQGTNKYQLKGNVSIFVVNDDAVLLTYHTPSKITEALES